MMSVASVAAAASAAPGGGAYPGRPRSPPPRLGSPGLVQVPLFAPAPNPVAWKCVQSLAAVPRQPRPRAAALRALQSPVYQRLCAHLTIDIGPRCRTEMHSLRVPRPDGRLLGCFIARERQSYGGRACAHYSDSASRLSRTVANCSHHLQIMADNSVPGRIEPPGEPLRQRQQPGQRRRRRRWRSEAGPRACVRRRWRSAIRLRPHRTAQGGHGGRAPRDAAQCVTSFVNNSRLGRANKGQAVQGSRRMEGTALRRWFLQGQALLRMQRIARLPRQQCGHPNNAVLATFFTEGPRARARLCSPTVPSLLVLCSIS